MNILKGLGRALRILRKMQGITQEALCQEAGIDQSYFSEVEQGIKDPGLKYIAKVARFLKVEVADFFWLGRTPQWVIRRVEVALDGLIFGIIERGRRDLAKRLLRILKQREQRLEEFLLRSEAGAQKQSQNRIRKGREE